MYHYLSNVNNRWTARLFFRQYSRCASVKLQASFPALLPDLLGCSISHTASELLFVREYSRGLSRIAFSPMFGFSSFRPPLANFDVVVAGAAVQRRTSVLSLNVRPTLTVLYHDILSTVRASRPPHSSLQTIRGCRGVSTTCGLTPTTTTRRGAAARTATRPSFLRPGRGGAVGSRRFGRGSDERGGKYLLLLFGSVLTTSPYLWAYTADVSLRFEFLFFHV